MLNIDLSNNYTTQPLLEGQDKNSVEMLSLCCLGEAHNSPKNRSDPTRIALKTSQKHSLEFVSHSVSGHRDHLVKLEASVRIRFQDSIDVEGE